MSSACDTSAAMEAAACSCIEGKARWYTLIVNAGAGPKCKRRRLMLVRCSRRTSKGVVALAVEPSAVVSGNELA
jgi:hypothetical protein